MPKLKQVKQLVASLFPVEFGPAFDRCRDSREVRTVTETLNLARGFMEARENELVKEYATRIADLSHVVGDLEVKVSDFERRATVPAVVREPQDQVVLMGGLKDTNGYINKIGLIKAIREITNLGLRESKDIVDDVFDHSMKRPVFSGDRSKADSAVRKLIEAGGIVEKVAV